MAFKLLVEVTDDGKLNVEHEGQIDPAMLMGSLEIIKHSILLTMDAGAVMEENEPAPEGEENK